MYDRDVYDMFRWWRCIRRWLGEFTTNLRQTFRNVDLLANSAFLQYAVNYFACYLVTGWIAGSAKLSVL